MPVCLWARTVGWLALAAPAILIASPAGAQQHDAQLWLQTNTNVPVAEGVRLTVEHIARFGDRFGGLYQTEFGGILGIRVAEGLELGVGYRHVGTHSRNPAADEERLRQHLIATVGPVVMRLRLDERFHPDGAEIGFRIRPLIRYNQRLGGTRLVPFVSHESFYLPNSTRWGQRRGYERMRNIIGFAVPLGRRLSADVGYLNQYRLARGGARAQMDHALNLQLTLNLQAVGAPHLDD